MQLTPTQQRIYDVLADGERHSVFELRKALGDELAVEGTLAVHICYLRRALAAHGLNVMHQGQNGNSSYRLVRHVTVGE